MVYMVDESPILFENAFRESSTLDQGRTKERHSHDTIEMRMPNRKKPCMNKYLCVCLYVYVCSRNAQLYPLSYHWHSMSTMSPTEKKKKKKK